MVSSDESGQLFTIEGLVAGLIMLSTAFIVAGSITIYTPGDAHISDMQLKQLGSDALLMLDTPDNSGEKSTLRTIVEKGSTQDAKDLFKDAFEKELTKGTGTSDIVDSIRYNATVYYRDILIPGTSTILSYPLGDSGSEVTRQPEISTGRFVLVHVDGQNRIYRVEVRLWRE